MKCKVMCGSSKTLEDEVNEFLTKNPHIGIVTCEYSTSVSSSGTMWHNCLIIYRELAEVRKEKLEQIENA